MDKERLKRIIGYLFSKKFWASQLISRRKISRLLPDKTYLKMQTYVLRGEKLDLKNPKRLNHKLQWLKLYDRKPIYTQLVDKYLAKEYIAKRFGEEYVVPTYGVWKTPEEIDFDSLPNQFVLKCNHNCAEGICICKDKSTLNKEEAKAKLGRALKKNFYWQCREWPYKNVPPLILAEKYLETKEGKIPNDYKLHYINGELQFVYVSYDRQGVNDRCVYDSNWNRLPFVWVPALKPDMNTADVPCPQTFEQMKDFGAQIAKDFKYVRVDYYDIDGKLYFGEITLFHGAGYDYFFPDEYDFIFGEKLKLK